MCEALDYPPAQEEPLDRGLPYAHIYYVLLKLAPRNIAASFLFFYKDYTFIRKEWKWERQRRAELQKEVEQLRALIQSGVLLDQTTPDIRDARIDEKLKEYGYPANTRNAARAGWYACLDYLKQTSKDLFSRSHK